MHSLLSIVSRTAACIVLPTLAIAQSSPAERNPLKQVEQAARTTNAAFALQQDFITVAKRVFPSIVTVRTFVRVAPDEGKQVAAGEGPVVAGAVAVDLAADTPDTDAAQGWVAVQGAISDYPGYRLFGSGSGFFVGDDGALLTALQPLQVAKDRLVDLIEVETSEGHRILADVVGIEPTLQLAVLKGAVYQTWERSSMKPLKFGDSESLEIGSLLMGFGDPLGPERFLGTGLLVAKPSRDCYQELMGATYMQATMLVPTGAHGGPLVNLDGEVVGILSRLEIEGVGQVATTGSAWALPSKILSGLFASIQAANTMQSPWLGFSVMSRTEVATIRGFKTFQAMSKPKHGILLENLFQPSPAQIAGLQSDDWLIEFNGVAIHAPVAFQRQLYLTGVGRKAVLTFFRAGETFTKEIVIERRPEAVKPR